jgi:hypothetical protein
MPPIPNLRPVMIESKSGASWFQDVFPSEGLFNWSKFGDWLNKGKNAKNKPGCDPRHTE